MQAKNQKC